MLLSEADLAERFEFARTLTQEAGVVAMHHFRSGRDLGIVEKGAQDLVTIADHQVDALIRQAIANRFPGDGILTEESGGTVAPHLWVIDPIDGTGNFARGIANFAISIAFCVNGISQIGIVLDPAANELFSARRGHGAFCNGVRINVSTTNEIGRAAIDAGYSRRTPLPDYVSLIARILDAGGDFVQFGSAALGLAQVASGRTDGYVEAHLYAWDVLAGLLLVEEAGGYHDGFSLDGSGQTGMPVMACTPGLRQQLQKIVGEQPRRTPQSHG
jgi:myo-inositol-1(or 4)-monophosphatase